MFKVLLAISLISTFVIWLIEDNTKTEIKKIGNQWLIDFKKALGSKSPSLPEVDMKDAKRHSQLLKREKILWWLKGVIYLADIVFLIMTLQ